jgi:hypothetical protein
MSLVLHSGELPGRVRSALGSNCLRRFSFHRTERQAANDKALTVEHESAGTVEIMEAAAIWACWTSYCWAKRAIATGTVAVSREVQGQRDRKLFPAEYEGEHARSHEPGHHERQFNLPEDPRWKAAVHERRFLKLLRAIISQIVIGRLMVRWVMTSATRLSRSPS